MPSHPFPWHATFLAALREYPVLGHACKAAGIDRATAWRHKTENKEFGAAVEQAMEEGIDRAEQEAMRRGVVGFEEPVIDKGQLAYRYERYLDAEGKEAFRKVLDEHGQPVPLTVRKHSDAMLSLVLKARRKAYSTERTELTNPDGTLAPIDETTRAARIAQLMAAGKARKAAEASFEDLA